jgi:hypothetical protein
LRALIIVLKFYLSKGCKVTENARELWGWDG